MIEKKWSGQMKGREEKEGEAGKEKEKGDIKNNKWNDSDSLQEVTAIQRIILTKKN